MKRRGGAQQQAADAGTVAYTESEWRPFATDVENGEFDI
ncbi:hypothetical protein MINT15_35180 [Saccharomonospora viridis]|uniref:DUF397 domain-containing protein n=1 Tax=Saccharomonospora viridis TaxID=1852 RepID=A0A837DBY5_9PSEU|nr:hypothetical protein MINT15_35180 [Saccharomonospora viridis]